MTYLLSILPIYQNVLAWAFYEPGSLPVSILHTYALKSTQPTKVGIIILALGPTTELLLQGQFSLSPFQVSFQIYHSRGLQL